MNEQVDSNKVDRKAFALLFVGASLYWPLLRRNGLFFSLAGHDATNAESLFWLSFFLLLCAVAVAICCMLEHRAHDIIERRGAALLGMFGLQAICKNVEVFIAPSGPVGQLLALLDVVLYAFAFVVLTYMWSAWYLSMERRETVLYASATFAASFLLGDMIRLFPQAFSTVLFSLVPFVSAFIWVAYHRVELPRVSNREDGVAPMGSFAWSLVVILAVFLLVGGLIRGGMTGVVNGEVSEIQLAMDVVTGMFGVLLVVFSLLYRSPGKFLLNAWSAAVVVFFAGLLLTAGFSGDEVERGRQTVIVGRTCLDLIYWIVLIELVRDQHLSLIRTIGVWFVIVDVMSSLIGYILAPMAFAAMGIGFEQAAVPLAAATAFILIVASILFFNRAFGSPRLEGAAEGAAVSGVPAAPAIATTPAAPSSTIDAQLIGVERAEHVDSVLAQYRLSERELEVAELLADGNSQKKIAESLCLSLGTVQSHIKSIYRKLDIHSRQELIDMMR